MAFMPFIGQDPRAPLPVRNVPERAAAVPLQARGGIPMAPGARMAVPQAPVAQPRQDRGGLLSVPYAGARGGILSLGAPEAPEEDGGLLGGLNPLQAIGLAMSGIGDIAGGQNNLANSLQTLMAMREMQQRVQGKPGDFLKEINGQLVDIRTGQVVGDYRTPEQPKRDLFTVTDGDQTKTFIGDKGDPSTWQPVAEADRYRPTTSTNVTVNSGGLAPNPFEKADQETIGSLAEGVTVARDLLPQIERIEAALDSGVETGRLESMALPLKQYAESLGWEQPGLGQQENIASAMAYLIPRMRVPGSGSTSDMEMANFERSVPNMKNTPTGNRIIAATFKQILQRKQKEMDILRQYYSNPDLGNGSLVGGWEYVDTQLGKLFPHPTSEEEYNALPEGTVYLHPENGYSVKRTL